MLPQQTEKKYSLKVGPAKDIEISCGNGVGKLIMYVTRQGAPKDDKFHPVSFSCFMVIKASSLPPNTTLEVTLKRSRK